MSNEVKRVPCAYQDCGLRRPHHERPDEQRGTQQVEVPWDYEGRAYCSMTCAIMGGSLNLRATPTGEELDRAHQNWQKRTKEIKDEE